jgi:hypothetical protein
MRYLIDLMEDAELPTLVYHGTSDKAWEAENGSTLYLTASRKDAEIYAEEAVVADFYELGIDWEEGMEMPSRAIVVEFPMSDLMEIQERFGPDWGWENAAQDTAWKDSLRAVGSFTIEGFTEKHLGKITPAF